MVWSWYRYIDTKLFSCAKYHIYPHGLKLVSISPHQIVFTCKICNIYPHGLKLVSISLHQIIFMSKISNIYLHGLKLVSTCRYQIICMWNTCNIYTHCLKIGIETLKPNVFLFVKYSTIINIHFIDSMSKPNVLFRIITVFLCV